MKRLENKVAIITGSAQGMGATHAERFIKEGAKVVITDLNEEKGRALANQLGNNSLFIKQDVTRETDWQRVIEKTQKAFGKINILVNNAGITMNKSILKMTEEEYLRIVKINQLSVFMGIKNAALAMKDNNGGAIINISSINGIVGGAAGYTDTKFAVRGLTKAAVLELAKYGIRVNSVHPGVIATPMVEQGDTKNSVEAFAKHIPLQRIAQPNEVSNLVLYLASDESLYSTGSEFIIDGGLTAM
ncbi:MULTISPECIES: glucose 1-dehydrogenase [unclassified Carboxylicivirga]|uniref:glucose 1-dehydrogenase n=1 Tax=Carboxylicivirga TaxID=1628153 RepID=UPI003D340B1B